MVSKLTLVGDLGSPPRNSINMLENSNEETEAKSKHIIAHICVLCAFESGFDKSLDLEENFSL